MKQYIGIVRDHSGSMNSLVREATDDFNENLSVIQKEAKARDIDTLVSVVECGIGSSEVRRAEVLKSVERVKPLTYYETNGMTPLWDSIAEVINIMENVPDKDDPGVAFLVLVITDGQENYSKTKAYDLGQRIKKLQGTDKWTFTFRVPKGDASIITRELNTPKHNVIEWEQTSQGIKGATRATATATQAYYNSRSAGFTSVDSFYANVGHLKSSQLKKDLDDITREVDVLNVKKGGELIQPFVERETGKPYLRGAGFYQLTKPEPKVQSSKQIVIRDKVSGKFYGGGEARNLLGLPSVGSVKLSPGDHGQYDVFVQSTSVNRKLIAGTEVVYWPRVRR